jgi:hypothetical protein
VILAVVAGLLLLGLLVLERSGSNPVQPLRNISSGQPGAANASGPAGHNNAVAQSALPTLNGATISGGGNSQMTGSSNQNGEQLCTSFTGGTAPTVSTVSYDTKDTTISKVTVPGAFYYFVKVQVTTPGTQTFTVTQSSSYAPTTGTALFAEQSGGSAYDGSCNMLSTTVTGDPSSLTVTFTAPTAGTYILGLHYMTHSIVGSADASSTAGFTYNYTFATTGASGSTQGLTLTHV